MTRDEAVKKLSDLGFLTPEQLVDGLAELGVLTLKEPESPFSVLAQGGWNAPVVLETLEKAGYVVTKPMHPHLANALERARTWQKAYPAGCASDGTDAFGAMRLLRDVAEASK